MLQKESETAEYANYMYADVASPNPVTFGSGWTSLIAS